MPGGAKKAQGVLDSAYSLLPHSRASPVHRLLHKLSTYMRRTRLRVATAAIDAAGMSQMLSCAVVRHEDDSVIDTATGSLFCTCCRKTATELTVHAANV